jgi:hypothetical protein
MVLRRVALAPNALIALIPARAVASLRVEQPLPHGGAGARRIRVEQDKLPADQAIVEPQALGRDQQADADQVGRVQEVPH